MRVKRQLFLGFGSNLGDRADAIARARHAVAQRLGPIIKASELYETAAWGITDQSDFLNQVVIYQTQLSPHQVLHEVLQQELRMGRTRGNKWSARSIDIDILFQQDLEVNAPDLIIPHPHISRRKFILVPLAAIAAEFKHPTTGDTMKSMLDKCTDSSLVKLYKA